MLILWDGEEEEEKAVLILWEGEEEEEEVSEKRWVQHGNRSE